MKILFDLVLGPVLVVLIAVSWLGTCLSWKNLKGDL
jgi:hypothetical protein